MILEAKIVKKSILEGSWGALGRSWGPRRPVEALKGRDWFAPRNINRLLERSWPRSWEPWEPERGKSNGKPTKEAGNRITNTDSSEKGEDP